MNKKTFMLLAITVFLLIPILLVYAADKPVNPDDTIGLVDSGALYSPNPATSDTISLNDAETGLHPRNPVPNDTISLSGLVYYDGAYYNGGGDFTPPTKVYNLMSFLFPLVIMIAGGGFVIALARNRPYRIVEWYKHE